MKQRDLELLSSYLDGQLSSSDSARLEARLHADPGLRSVLDDLRSTRSLLRQLPMRKAPRNFKLTPKMVGKNPPLPRAYPIFRLSSVLATIMLFLTFGLNFLGPQLASASYGYGGLGGGGGAAESEAYGSAAPAATEAPAAATEAPVAEPSLAQAAPLATQTIAAAEDATRMMDTPTAKTAEDPYAISPPQEPPVASRVPARRVSPVWQWLLAGIAVVSAFIMAMMRQLSISRWRKK